MNRRNESGFFPCKALLGESFPQAACLLIALASLIPHSGFGQAVTYTVIDLGTLGGTVSYAEALNNAGQIVGQATPSGGQFHAAFWASGQSGAYNLGPATLSYVSEANAINNSGQIVGDSSSSNFSEHAMYWSSSFAGMVDLGTLTGSNSMANGINDSGQIVGSADVITETDHAVYWAGGSGPPQDIGTLGGDEAEAYGINNSGQIVGNSTTSGGNDHAAYWASHTSSPVDLGTLGGSSSLAYSINNSGQTVGIAANSNNVDHAAFWTNSSSPPVDLGSLNGSASAAYFIDSLGRIVGTSDVTGVSVPIAAVLWTNYNSPPVNLNNLIPTNSGWILLKAFAINAMGEIVGSGGIGGQEHGYMLIPAVNLSLQSTNLTFTTQPGVTYFLQSRTNLISGSWTNISTNVGAGGLTNIVLEYLVGTNKFADHMRFFRITADF